MFGQVLDDLSPPPSLQLVVGTSMIFPEILNYQETGS